MRACIATCPLPHVAALIPLARLTSLAVLSRVRLGGPPARLMSDDMLFRDKSGHGSGLWQCTHVVVNIWWYENGGRADQDTRQHELWCGHIPSIPLLCIAWCAPSCCAMVRMRLASTVLSMEGASENTAAATAAAAAESVCVEGQHGYKYMHRHTYAGM